MAVRSRWVGRGYLRVDGTVSLESTENRVKNGSSLERQDEDLDGCGLGSLSRLELAELEERAVVRGRALREPTSELARPHQARSSTATYVVVITSGNSTQGRPAFLSASFRLSPRSLRSGRLPVARTAARRETRR